MLKTLSCVLLATGVVLVNAAGQAQRTAETRASREDAYRANNVGVARLEQFDYPAAVQSFRHALEIAPALTMARVNLAIALYYAGDLAGARREAETAARQQPPPLQAGYVLGLIARAENRNADAIAAFERVRRADPNDVGGAVNLGQLYLQEQKFPEAVEAFRRATSLEPYQATAAYGLATALLRSGAREEGSEAMARFQKLRDSGYATTFSTNYLEQGRYAAAIASTGAEPELVDTAVPGVKFTDMTSSALPGTQGGASAIALVDVDADGDPDLALGTSEGVALLRNDRGRFTAFSSAAALARIGRPHGIAAGDYNNDERPDLLLLMPENAVLLAQQSGGSFKDVTSVSELPKITANAAAWADADHDGDLDIAAPPFLLRNNGNGTFTDVSAASGFSSVSRATAIAPADFDNRRDIDFLVVGQNARPTLLRNMRDGSFQDASEGAGLTRTASWSGIASGDLNKDGFVDFLLSQLEGPPIFATSNGSGRFALSEARIEASVANTARAAMFIDYDNDGLLDALLVTAKPTPTLLRNVGTGWRDVTVDAFPVPETGEHSAGAAAQIAAGDLDDDGDTDVVTTQGGRVAIWRNDGGSRHASLKVQLASRVSNHSALGARVEMRAGSLSQQLETGSATPASTPADVLFGLGSRAGADVVRVLWPAGILQAEVAPEGKLLSGRTSIRELDRKPSSCPYLYTWNGSRFEFVTDFLGGGEMGYWEAPGVRNTPDPDEYVRIDSTQLQARDGRYELRVTNELEEALFLDHVRLLAVDHPEAHDVYPNEGMTDPPKSGVFVTRNPRPPLAATDEHGHDVLDRIVRMDRRYPDDFGLENVRGYAKPHSLALTLPRRAANQRAVLLLAGWTDYAFSRDNVAASQQALKLEPPSLAIKDAGGRWRTVNENIGIPVGRPQTVTVEVPADATEVRISTNMRIYWDHVQVAEKGGQSPFPGTDAAEMGTVPAKMGTVPISSASLRWRGFSAEVAPDGREPFGYDYSRVTPDSPWKLMPGRYTREGDVRELLAAVDDMFVVSRPGDEIALSFDAAALAPLRPGWTRTFLLYADGFSKEMDPHSSSPDTLEPLPFHGMTRYPYTSPERYPDDQAHRSYVERYNTRVVRKSVPSIDVQLRASPRSAQRNAEKKAKNKSKK